MNPYETPSSTASGDSLPTIGHYQNTGLPCPDCGSTNTGQDQALRTKPSVFVVLFFGWIFILMRTAFSKRTETCRDCGSHWSYRSRGNNVALLVLVLLVAIIALAMQGKS
jgi:uncharacterized protein (DUF983 family)